jgi:transcription elongation factor Elf1
METYHSDLLGNVTIPDDLVAEHDACPACGERHVDWLAWDDDGETVTCQTCGARYDPMEQ